MRKRGFSTAMCKNWENKKLGNQKIYKIIHKNNHQMPNIELLFDNIAQIIKTKEKEPTVF